MAKRDWIGIDLGQTGALALLPEDGARLVSEVDRSPGAGQPGTAARRQSRRAQRRSVATRSVTSTTSEL